MASSTPVFVIRATPKKPVLAEIVGVNYTVKAPKSALLLAISNHSGKNAESGEALNRDLQTILKLMFGAKAWQGVQDRLNSADDELDIDHIFEAVEQLTESQTGNPTS